MGAGTDADIVAIAPIDEVVPALGARPGVVGDLVGRQAGGREPLLRQLEQRGGGVLVGRKRTRRAAGALAEGRVRLDRQLIERQMLAGERRAPRSSSPSQAGAVCPGRA